MSANEIKRKITQGELDAAYAAVEERREKRPTAAVPATPEGLVKAALLAGGGEGLGLQICEDRTVIVEVSRKGGIERRETLLAGFGDPDKLLNELSLYLQSRKAKLKMPVYLTLSGRPAHFFVTRVPKLARPLMLKALKLQMKQATGEERDEISYLALPTPMKMRETHAEYLVATVDKPMVEKINQTLRKAGIKAHAWDLDFLCVARTAAYAWQKSGAGDSTRFLVMLEWEKCNLLVQSADGRLIAPTLSIGVQSFLQHLKNAREVAVPISSDNKNWHALPADAMDMRQRRVLSAQAIHDVYMPLVGQIKAQLYAGCSENGIPLPTHFTIVGPGHDSFGLSEALAKDLNLTELPLAEVVPVDEVEAFGAALWERTESHFNFLPRGRREWLKTLQEKLARLQAKLSPGLGASNMGSPGEIKWVSIGALAVAFMVGYPTLQRYRASNDVETARNELYALQSEKTRIEKAKERDAGFDKKMQMVKQIEAKREVLSTSLRELFTVLPGEIKLQSLAFKNNVFTLKGLSHNEVAIEQFLKAALSLKTLMDPTPIGITRDKDGTTFEITFRLKT